MQSEKEKLEILLSVEIEHNRNHVAEFQELAEKAREIGEAMVCDNILAGVEQMNSANESFTEALERLQRQKS